MSGAVDFFVSVFSAVGQAIIVVGEAFVGTIVLVHQKIFQEIVAPVLKPVFRIFGIKDQTIHSTELFTQQIIPTESTYFTRNLLAALANSSDLSAAIKFVLLTGPISTLHSYLNYGKQHYVNGLPTISLNAHLISRTGIQNTLDALHGEPVTLLSIDKDTPNEEYWCKWHVTKFHNYDVKNDLVLLPFTSPVFKQYQFDSCVFNEFTQEWDITFASLIEQIVNTVTDVDTVFRNQNWWDDTTITTTITDHWTGFWLPDIVNVSVSTSSSISELDDNNNLIGSPGLVSTETEVINIINKELYTLAEHAPKFTNNLYYFAKYVINSDSITQLLWFLDTGQEPEGSELVDDEFITEDSLLESFPVLLLRRAGVSINTDTNSEEYKTGKILMDKLGITDIDTFITQIEQSPDIALIQDAFLTIGINIYGTDEASKSYLFMFFFFLSALPGNTKQDFLSLDEESKSLNNIIYSVNEENFRSVLKFSYIDTTVTSSTLRPSGTIEIDYNIFSNTASGTTFLSNGTSKGLVNSNIVLRWQQTESTLITLTVQGLALLHFIKVDSSNFDIKVIELTDPASTVEADILERNNFVIPLSNTILRSLPVKFAEQIAHVSPHLTIYAHQAVELDWYQTPAFLSLVQVLLTIAAIVIFIYTLGTGSELSAALLELGTQLLVQFGLTLILREILKHNLSDSEKAVVLALFVAASVSTGLGTGGELASLNSLLLGISSVSIAITIDTELRADELLEEQQAFEDQVTSREEELAFAQEFLDSTVLGVDTFDLLTASRVTIIDTTISPTQFFNKSLSTNLAPLVLSDTSVYHANRLDINNIDIQTSQTSIDVNSILDISNKL